MSWLTRLRNALGSSALDQDLEREMRFHLEERAHELATGGLDPRDAAADARRRFGNYTSLKESARAHRLIPWIEGYATATRRAWRSLRRTPGFLILAAGSLAVALGLATTVSAEIESLLHPYMPVAAPERLYVVGLIAREPGLLQRISTNDVLTLFRASPAVDTVVILGAAQGSPELLSATSEALALMDLQVRLGRRFLPDETAESHVVMIPEEMWETRYAGRTSLDSATLTVNNVSYRIVGVLPRHYWSGSATVLTPPPAGPPVDPVYLLRVRAGTKDTVFRLAAAAVEKQIVAEYGAAPGRISVTYRRLQPDPFRLNDLHRALMGAAVFILLIACANVSALMLARSAARRREHALKTALGAGPGDVIRDILAEVGLVCGIGAAAGLVLADWIMRLLVALMPAQLRLAGFVDPRWDARVFGWSLGALVLAIGAAAVLPAWYVTQIPPADPLKGGAATTTGRPARRFQWVIAGELALAMVLLLGAALIMKSTNKVATFDFGYNPAPLSRLVIGASVIADDAIPPPTRRPYPVIQVDELDAIVAKVRTLPGVQSAAWVTRRSTVGASVVSDISIDRNNTLSGPVMLDVGPGFIATIGLPILEGRDFSEGDAASGGAVILDVRAAQSLFPAGGAIGRLVRLGAGGSNRPWLRVVGIVANAIHALPAIAELDPRGVMYLSRPATNINNPGVLVRSRPGTQNLAETIVGAVKPMVPPAATVTSGEWVSGYTGQLTARRFASGIFIALSVASLILGTAGLVGVLSYSVSQRMREFAIRTALGASRRSIVGSVARDALVMALGGTAVGGILALGAAFTLYNWLWGVYPIDAGALVAAEAVLLTVTVGAAAAPAWRATRAEPLEVIRAS